MSNLQAVKTQLKVGDIILSRVPGSPISEVIQGVTRSRWSHALMYVGDDTIIESDWDGVVVGPLSKYLSGKFEIGLFRIQPELTEEEQAKLVRRARLYIGTKYAYVQLVWGLILRLFGQSENKKWHVNVKNKMICSELVARCYKKIGRPIKNLPPAQMEPADFDDSPLTIRIA